MAAVFAPACNDRPRMQRNSQAPAVEYVAPAAPAAAAISGGAVAPGQLEWPGKRTAEKEPNNDGATANAVSTETIIAAALTDASDLDVYAIEVAQPTTLAALVAPEGDACLTVRDAEGHLLAKSDRGGKGVTEGVPNLWVPAGRFTIEVSAFAPKPPKRAKLTKPPAKGPSKGAESSAAAPAIGPGFRYEFAARFPVQLAESAEVEPNGERTTASSIVLGDASLGWIGWAGDLDVWKVDVEAFDAQTALDIECSAVDGGAPTVTVMDAAGKTLVRRVGAKSQPLWLSGLVWPAGTAANTVYVSVSAERANPVAPYRLNLQARGLAVDEEREPNDIVSTPMPLALAEAVRGTWTVGDTDYFVLAPAPSDGRIMVALQGPAELELVAALAVEAFAVPPKTPATAAGGAPVTTPATRTAPGADQPRTAGLAVGVRRDESTVVSVDVPNSRALVVRVRGPAMIKAPNAPLPYTLRATFEPVADPLPPEVAPEAVD